MREKSIPYGLSKGMGGVKYGISRGRQRIINMEVDVVDLKRSVELVHDLALEGGGHYVCLSNVHMCMESFDNTDFSSIVNRADLVIPDGKPLSWAQKLLGRSRGTQVRGQDLMDALCKMGEEKGLNIGLYGGQSDSHLSMVKKSLLTSYPGLNISFACSPPFRPLTSTENGDVMAEINGAKVDILFVGIGCPKQERWMEAHREQLSCVMLGVGAAFDFIAGNKKHAPEWVQKIGMEWFFRLVSEPERLWKRYLKQNPRFIWYFFQQWLFGREYR